MLKVYYKKALQNLAYCLTFKHNKKLAEELFVEDSEQKLEEYIKEQKQKLDEKRFFFNAGLASQRTLEEAEEDGCEGFNLCVGGLVQFEKFIGLD